MRSGWHANWRNPPDSHLPTPHHSGVLYDTTSDVIRKALRGLDLAPATAAERAGLPEKAVLSATRERADAELLKRLAPVLGLDSDALAGLETYQPIAELPGDCRRLELPFGDETVNTWWIADANDRFRLLFDAGVDGSDLRSAIGPQDVQSVDLLITHPHHDHIGGVEGIRPLLRSVSGPMNGALPLAPGDRIERGRHHLRVIALPGHCDGAIGYVITSRTPWICVTGDALFAGSMGGCAPGAPYREALAALRREVLNLPDDTLLLPGHGPATTVGQEKRSNPFLGVNAAGETT